MARKKDSVDVEWALAPNYLLMPLRCVFSGFCVLDGHDFSDALEVLKQQLWLFKADSRCRLKNCYQWKGGLKSGRLKVVLKPLQLLQSWVARSFTAVCQLAELVPQRTLKQLKGFYLGEKGVWQATHNSQQDRKEVEELQGLVEFWSLQDWIFTVQEVLARSYITCKVKGK